MTSWIFTLRISIPFSRRKSTDCSVPVRMRNPQLLIRREGFATRKRSFWFTRPGGGDSRPSSRDGSIAFGSRALLYAVPARAKRVKPLLTQMRSISVVTTHGSSKLANAVGGEPGKRVALRGLRALCGFRTPVQWVACYGMDQASDRQRHRFIKRANAAMSRI